LWCFEFFEERKISFGVTDRRLKVILASSLERRARTVTELI